MKHYHVEPNFEQKLKWEWSGIKKYQAWNVNRTVENHLCRNYITWELFEIISTSSQNEKRDYQNSIWRKRNKNDKKKGKQKDVQIREHNRMTNNWKLDRTEMFTRDRKSIEIRESNCWKVNIFPASHLGLPN